MSNRGNSAAEAAMFWALTGYDLNKEELKKMSNFPVSPMPQVLDGAVIERTFIRNVYAWMFGGLMLTALSSLWVVVSPAMQQLILKTPMVAIGLLIATFGLVMFLSFRAQHLAPATAASLFLVYSVLTGLALSGIFFLYTAGSILTAFVTASGMFGAMSIYGMVTKRDLTGWGSFFFMGLIGLILCGVVNIFLKSSAMSFVISIVGVLVFTGLTAYDTQKLKSMARASGPGTQNFAILGALSLYLDFLNLFLMLLRLFGSRK